MKKIVPLSALCVSLTVLCLCFALYAAYNVTYFRRETVVSSNISTGDQIVNALEGFYMQNKLYPASLEELTPNYILHIKNPDSIDAVWSYRRINENEYLLAFGNRKSWRQPTGWKKPGQSWAVDYK